MQRARSIFGINNLQFRTRLVELGLLGSHTNYKKFILLGRSRTGSNYLRGLLNGSRNIVVLGEILKNPDKIEWGDPSYVTTRYDQLYQDNLADFIDQAVFRRLPKDILALGFKLFYYHAREQNRAYVWEYLHQLRDLHVIHIKRRNILKTHLSKALAERSNRWVATNEDVPAIEPITLDYERCLNDFIQTREWEAENDQYFNQLPQMEIWYEDLSKDYTGEMEKIFDFLGLKPQDVSPQTFKQRQVRLSESIANFQELKANFSNSPWAEFFVDE